jgi:hypothetical protein
MNAKEALQEIKKLLFTDNSTQKFAMVDGKLEDGTAVKYDLESGDIFVVGQDGADVPAPVGEHKLETGEVVVVVEEGKISEVKKAEDKPKEEVAAAEDEPVKEDKKEDDKKIEEQMSAMEEKYAALEKKIDEMQKKMDEMGHKEDKMNQAIVLSAQVLESLATEPSADAIQKPNTFYKEVKDAKQQQFNKLQQVFQNLKIK